MPDERITVRLPARFLSAGQCVAHPGWVHPRRTLDSSVLIAVERGRLGIYVGEERFAAGEGQALLLPAGVPHSGFPVGRGEEPVYVWAHFRGGEADTGQEVRPDSLCAALAGGSRDRMINTFHQLISESSTRGGGLTCDYLLSLLLLELCGKRETPRSVLTNRVLEYIRLHCYERLTLDDLNRAFGYSGDYLSRLFHEDMHMPFRQYIHQLRLLRAKRELLGGVKSVGQIAEECGYGNAKFFSTVFMKQEGISPSAYRSLYGSLHQNDA